MIGPVRGKRREERGERRDREREESESQRITFLAPAAIWRIRCQERCIPRKIFLIDGIDAPRSARPGTICFCPVTPMVAARSPDALPVRHLNPKLNCMAPKFKIIQVQRLSSS